MPSAPVRRRNSRRLYRPWYSLPTKMNSGGGKRSSARRASVPASCAASRGRRPRRPNDAQREGRTVGAEGRPLGPAPRARSTTGVFSSRSSRSGSATRSRPARAACGAISPCSRTRAFRGTSTATTATYQFAEGYSLRRLNLSQRELLGLVTLKRLGSSLGGTLSAYIEETTSKLLQSSDQRSAERDAVVVAGDSAGVGGARAERRAQLRDAAERRARSSASCASTTPTRTARQDRQRRVDPYGFIVSNGRIYLVAYDHARTDMRVFAIDNIDAIAVLPQTFERPADFNLEAYGAHSVSGVWQSSDLTDVTVRFSPVVAKAAAAASVARDRRDRAARRRLDRDHVPRCRSARDRALVA